MRADRIALRNATRALLHAAVVASVWGCGDGPVDVDDVPGSYGLIEVNGAPLPAPLRDGGGIVTGGILSLRVDRTATALVCGGKIICSTVHAQMEGKWDLTPVGQLRITSGSVTRLATRNIDGWTIHWGTDDIRFR